MELELPDYVLDTLNTLNEAGYAAYVVGGAVRSLLLKEEPNNWNVNESVFCIRVNKRCMNNRYFCYEITNVRYYDDLLMDATGTTFKSIKQNNLKQSRLLVPPLSEQQAIADYLDETCSKIDEIIAEAKASIDEYKKLRQGIIFEAVTKGLDKNVEMKSTSVGWIGTVPSHWRVAKIRQVAEFYNGDRSSKYPSGNDIVSECIIFIT